MNISSDGGTVFNWLVSVLNESGFISWIVCCIVYLRFRAARKAQDVQDLPHQSFLQPYGAWFALVIVALLALLNGFACFFSGNFTASGFLTAYLGIPVFVVLYAGHKIYTRHDPWYHPVMSIDLTSGLDDVIVQEALYRDSQSIVRPKLCYTDYTVTNVGIFGNGAGYPIDGPVFLDYGYHPEGFEYGTFDIGGGSGTVRHTNLVTPLQAVQSHVESIGGRTQVILNNDVLAEGLFKTIYPVPEACLVFLKAYATEGSDRSSIDLPWNSTAVVEKTAAMCSSTVVVIHGPGVVLMPWADNENVTAILSAHYPGEEIGNSLVDVLWGAAEPSGRLPYTIPRNSSDYGPDILESHAEDGTWQADFNEGQLIDYRHFDADNFDPHFEFGFGLSYTSFEMVDGLQVNVNENVSALADESMGKQPGGLVDLWTLVAQAAVEITNTGTITGIAVPQLYISFPQDTTPAGTPVKVLMGFAKVALDAGESTTINFELTRRDLSFWDSDTKQWVIPQGEFVFMTGFSSRDIKSTIQTATLS